jgi:hypothetical protein
VRTATAVSLSIFLALIAWAESPSTRAGEMLYRQGILPSANPLRGERKNGGSAEGATAACVNCHRPSGLGTYEGRILVPPVTARYLFNLRSQLGPEADSADAPSTVLNHKQYNDVTLARAIREGINADGRPMSYLMPRYPLDDATMASLIAYLKGLSAGPVPGVSEDVLQFATIITPDADPLESKGMIDVLEHFFAAKNSFYRGNAPPMQRSTRVVYRVQRKWQLHVWQLDGAPETWQEQLKRKLQAEPVFAVISGVGGKTWEPVHQFCQQESLPCLLPNVDLPVVAENDFYNLYYSKGVLLEAQLIARRLQAEAGMPKPRKVIQVYRDDDIGVQAAQAFRDAAPNRLKIENRILKTGESARMPASIMEGAGSSDTVIILWLRKADLAALPPEEPRNRQIYFSGTMGGLENAPLPQTWRSVALMTYPFELPAARAARMNYPMGWFSIQHIPVVAERAQTNAYIACGILGDALRSMLDEFVRDYLLERIEDELSPRIVNGYYNRLSLAPGQRFASKGGYIVRFAEPTGKKLIAQGEWIVP